MNLLSWILLGLIVIGLGAAVRFLYRNRGAGCTGDCVRCSEKSGCGIK